MVESCRFGKRMSEETTQKWGIGACSENSDLYQGKAVGEMTGQTMGLAMCDVNIRFGSPNLTWMKMRRDQSFVNKE